MKPSEYIEININNKSILHLALMGEIELDSLKNNLNERFIDREEIKDKIKKKYDSLVRINKTSLKHFEEEILELLK